MLYIQNEDAFKKPIMHTAEWDSSVDLTNKRVAVIGTGCSAVQTVPGIALSAVQMARSAVAVLAIEAVTPIGHLPVKPLP